MRIQIVVLALTLALCLAAAATAWAQAGPQLGPPEADPAVERDVRATLRSIKTSMGTARRARTDWRLAEARLQARKADVDAALAECKERNPDRWAAACRVQVAAYRATDEDMREGLVEAIERYERKFKPMERVVRQRVHRMVTNPGTYRHLLAQSGRGQGGSRLLKLLLLSLDTIARMRTKMGEAITVAYLADLLDAVKALEEDIARLEATAPEIERIVDAYEPGAVARDPLSAYAYP